MILLGLFSVALHCIGNRVTAYYRCRPASFLNDSFIIIAWSACNVNFSMFSSNSNGFSIWNLYEYQKHML